jgi:hypothetical protein
MIRYHGYTGKILAYYETFRSPPYPLMAAAHVYSDHVAGGKPLSAGNRNCFAPPVEPK